MKHTAYRLFKKPFFGRFMKPWRWPEQVDAARWQRLSLASESGANLAALLGEARAGQVRGAVLLCHPMGTAAKGFWLKHGHAELLRAAGYHVMLFDLNGFGESSSTTMDYPLDVLAAGQALQARYPDLPVALLGASMGAAMGLCALALAQHPFKAAVLESAFPTLLHFWRPYPLPRLGIQLSRLLYPAGERRLRPLHAAQRLVGRPPLLLIYGEEDRHTPLADGQQLHAALTAATQCEFWQVPGADHTLAYVAQPEAYARRVLEFLDGQLGAAASPSCTAA